MVESLLGGSCFIESIAPETSSRSDLASFKLLAWTADPEAIPTSKWLAVPEPEEHREVFQPKALQYRVLIHLAAVTTFPDREEPWFLIGASSGSGQSGLPGSDMDMGGGATTRRCVWQSGVGDLRGDNTRGRAGAAVGRMFAAVVAGGRVSAAWQLPPLDLVQHDVGESGGPVASVQDRMIARLSAFDRLGVATCQVVALEIATVF